MTLAAVPPTENLHVADFVARHQAGLWRWLRALGCEAARAEEHCQDALLAALHEQVDRLPPEEAARWLRSAAKNLFLMQRRAERRRPRWLPLDDVEAAWVVLRGDADGGAAALAALDRCLLALPARDRELLLRRYVRGESRRAMAAALGLREAGVKQALRRIRDRLRECVRCRLAAQGEAPAIGNKRWQR